MLIDKLLRKRRLAVQRLASDAHTQQKVLQAERWLLQQRSAAFITSVPGLALSFSAGVLLQLRHNSAVKTLRSVIGLRWLKTLV